MLLIHNRRLQVIITTTTMQTSRAAYLRTLQKGEERKREMPLRFPFSSSSSSFFD